MLAGRIERRGPSEPGWERSYLDFELQFVGSVLEWLTLTDDEVLARANGYLGKLNGTLPDPLKITVAQPPESDLDSGKTKIKLGRFSRSGITVFFTQELKDQLRQLSTEGTVAAIVQIASQIVNETDKNLVYTLRSDLRDSLSQTYQLT